VGSDIELANLGKRIVEGNIGALLVAADAFFTTRRQRLLASLEELSIPAMFFERDYVFSGGGGVC
jgi:hypothetical protein